MQKSRAEVIRHDHRSKRREVHGCGSRDRSEAGIRGTAKREGNIRAVGAVLNWSREGRSRRTRTFVGVRCGKARAVVFDGPLHVNRSSGLDAQKDGGRLVRAHRHHEKERQDNRQSSRCALSDVGENGHEHTT